MSGRRPRLSARSLTSTVESVNVLPVLKAATRKPAGAYVGFAQTSRRTSVGCSVDLGEGTFALMRDGLNVLLVALEASACRLGGRRWWAQCPRCHRRIGVVYLTTPTLGCWKCLRLRFISEGLDRKTRLALRVRKIKRELGGADFDFLHAPPPPKPPRMRWVTYARLARKAGAALAEYERLAERQMIATRARLRRRGLSVPGFA